MFPNLKAEMARTSITSKDISRYLGKASSWLESRLQGRAKLPVEDAIKIKQKFSRMQDMNIYMLMNLY